MAAAAVASRLPSEHSVGRRYCLTGAGASATWQLQAHSAATAPQNNTWQQMRAVSR